MLGEGNVNPERKATHGLHVSSHLPGFPNCFPLALPGSLLCLIPEKVQSLPLSPPKNSPDLWNTQGCHPGFSWKAGPSVSRFEYTQTWQGWGLNPGEIRAYWRWTSCLTDCSYKAKPMLAKQALSLPSKNVCSYYNSSRIPSTHLPAYLIYWLCAALK